MEKFNSGDISASQCSFTQSLPVQGTVEDQPGDWQLQPGGGQVGQQAGAQVEGKS